MAGKRYLTFACKVAFALVPAFLAAAALCACTALGAAAIKVTELSLPEEKIVEGQPFWIGASVVNSGFMTFDFDGKLLIDGEIETSASATLEPSKPQTVTLSVKGLEAGKHTAAFNGIEQEFTVYRPAKLEVTDLAVEPTQVMAGETVKVRATVRNTGELEGTYSGALAVDGLTNQSCNVTLFPGDNATVEMELTLPDRGSHTVSLEGVSATVTVTGPNFEVVELTSDPPDPMAGDRVRVSATVRNSGDIEGLFDNPITYDGLHVSQCIATIAPGAEFEFAMDFVTSDRGSHTLALAGKEKTITVTAPASIAVESLYLTGTSAKPGEMVMAFVTLYNSGDQAGKQTVELFINGIAFERQEATVEAGGTNNVSFNISQDKGGTYVIKAGDFEETLNIMQIIRPATGTLLVKSANGGSTPVTFKNGCADLDAVFVLASKTNPAKPLLTVYVRAGQKTKAIKVKNGSYNIFYSTGNDYDAGSKAFLEDANYSVFDDAMRCNGSYRFDLAISVSNGNASTSGVDEGSFPR